MLTGLRCALALLTRIPVGTLPPGTHLDARAPLYFPLAGVVVGGGLALADWAAAALLPPLLGAVAVVAFWVWVSGALHLDGLGDCFDALMSGSGRERALEILRDPRVGTAGAAAIALALLAKVAALGSLAPEARPFGLLLAAVLGRSAMVGALLPPLARPDGLARAFRGPAIRAQAAGAAAGSLALAWALAAGAGVAAWLAALGALGWMLRTAWRRFGGTTGDVCGASAELCEVAALVALAGAQLPRAGGWAASGGPLLGGAWR